MKKEKQSIVFTSLKSAMLAVHKAEVTLADKLAAHYGKHSTTVPVLEYRKAFIAFAVSEGYCPRWAASMLVQAGIRLRAERSDKGSGRKNKWTAKAVLALIEGMSEAEQKAFARLYAKSR